jgi:hypothetical protein
MLDFILRLSQNTLCEACEFPPALQHAHMRLACLKAAVPPGDVHGASWPSRAMISTRSTTSWFEARRTSVVNVATSFWIRSAICLIAGQKKPYARLSRASARIAARLTRTHSRSSAGVMRLAFEPTARLGHAPANSIL